jgi:DNA (cytosine-5)-methyltransferase 1
LSAIIPETMKSLELFAGAGGLGLGLHGAGFEPLGVIERNRYCCDTIRENKSRGNKGLSKWKVIEGDVREVDFKSFEDKVVLVSGGPPCQPFSLGGKHGAHEDSRDMFPEAVRAVRQIRPHAFIFENVKGLTRSRFSNYFGYIRLQMEHPNLGAREGEGWTDHLDRLEKFHTAGKYRDLHYRVVTRVLNAADYGVPQKRERVFFVGFRDDLGIEWNFPPPTHSQEVLLWEQLVEGTYWERHSVRKKDRNVNSRRQSYSNLYRPMGEAWRTVRDALIGLPDPEHHQQIPVEYPNHRFQPGAKSYAGHTGSLLDEPAKALKAGVHGVPGGENMLSRPDGTVRYFTVRETARIQTFPDDFLFHGSWSETMRQLGNAVPVNLAEVVGKSVYAQLTQLRSKKRVQ